MDLRCGRGNQQQHSHKPQNFIIYTNQRLRNIFNVKIFKVKELKVLFSFLEITKTSRQSVSSKKENKILNFKSYKRKHHQLPAPPCTLTLQCLLNGKFCCLLLNDSKEGPSKSHAIPALPTEASEAALWHSVVWFPTGFFSSNVLLCTAQAPQPAPLRVSSAGDPLVPRSVLPRREIITTGSGLGAPTAWH